MSFKNREVVPLMYNLIERMSILGYPVVFKGSLVLRTLTEGKYNISRLIKDIDVDWQDKSITNDVLFDLIKQAVYSLGVKDLRVEQTRLFAEGVSAKFAIYLQASEKLLFTMDISVEENSFYTSYTTLNGYT